MRAIRRYFSSVVSTCWPDLVQWQNRKPEQLALSDLPNRWWQTSVIQGPKQRSTCRSVFLWSTASIISHPIQMEPRIEPTMVSYGHCDGESQSRGRVCWLLTVTQPRNVTWWIGRQPKSSRKPLHLPTTLNALLLWKPLENTACLGIGKLCTALTFILDLQDPPPTSTSQRFVA